MYSNGYNFTTDSVTSTTSTDFLNNLGAVGAGLAVLFVILGLFITAIVVFMIIAECKIFKKAGEPWWKALIPVYSTWIEAKIAGLAWWWCPIILGIVALGTFQNATLSYVVSFASLVIAFNFNYNICKKFGKSNGFAVLLTLLPIVGIPMLAFGSAKYDASVKTDKNGIFAVENSIAK